MKAPEPKTPPLTPLQLLRFPAAGADSGAEGAAPAPTLADAIAAGIESSARARPQSTQRPGEGAKQAEGEEDPDAAKGEEEEGSEKPAKPGEEKPDEKGEKKDPDHVNDPVALRSGVNALVSVSLTSRQHGQGKRRDDRESGPAHQWRHFHWREPRAVRRNSDVPAQPEQQRPGES